MRKVAVRPCCRRARRRDSRESSPRSSTPGTSPAGAAACGRRSRIATGRSSSSRAGSRARASAAAIQARCWSAITGTESSFTRARWELVSPTPSSSSSTRCSSRWRERQVHSMWDHLRVLRISSSRGSWASSSSWSGPGPDSSGRLPSRDSASTNLHARWCAKVAKETSVEVQIEGRTLKLTNLEKVLYPEVGFTKAQVIDYYTRIAPVLLPHTRNHPLTLKRYPNGVDGEFFYEKNCPKHRPPWVATATVWSGGNNRDMFYCLAQDLPTLVWLAQIATLEFHTSLSLGQNLPEPRTMVFDLDPGPPATIVECCRVGLMLRDVFREHGIDCCAKTSGSKGLQLYVPLNTKVTYDETKVVSKGLAQLFEEQHPDLVVHKQLKELRTGRVLIDWSQNDQYKTTVNVYSLRARSRPTVSTPVSWEEVDKCLKAGDPSLLVFDSEQVLARVQKLGDLFEPVVKQKQKLPRSLLEATGGAPAVEKMANRRHGTGRGRYPPQKGQRREPE